MESRLRRTCGQLATRSSSGCAARSDFPAYLGSTRPGCRTSVTPTPRKATRRAPAVVFDEHHAQSPIWPFSCNLQSAARYWHPLDGSRADRVIHHRLRG
jgi:hypothetical protein